jgi:hypothetical protein
VQDDEKKKKRMERVKAWQEEEAKRIAAEAIAAANPLPTAPSSSSGNTLENHNIPTMISVKKEKIKGWSLEDDDEDDKADEQNYTEEMEGIPPMLPAPKTQDIGESEGLTAFESMSKSTEKNRKREKISSNPGSDGQSKNNLIENESKTDDTTTVKLEKGATSKVAEVLLTKTDSLEKHSNKKISDDFDPLDDFMSSLYGQGEVEEQWSGAHNVNERDNKTIPIIQIKSDSIAIASSIDTATPIKNLSTKKDISGQKPNEDDYDDYSYLVDNPEINPFGSNNSALESKSPGASSSSGRNVSSRMDYSDSGWESDSAPPSPMQGGGYRDGGGGDRDGETEEEREKREDRERQEFIDAIRAARAAEDVAREKQKLKDEALEKGKEQLGRVFAGEGDVMDFEDIEEKKKSALEILEESKKGKELKPVDHKSIEYIPFRKNLYIVPRALSKLTEAEQLEKREDLQIKVRGKGCPAPIETWGQCGLSERVIGVIERLGLEAPFAIQKQAIPAIMCGRDLIGVAKTGSGKTLAFLLPMFRHIMDQPPLRYVSIEIFRMLY